MWRFSDPLNAPVAIAVLVIIGLISVLLPLLAMGLANIVSAKFEIRNLQAGEVYATVTDGTVRRAGARLNDSGQVIDIYHDRDMGLIVKNPRRFSISDVEFRARGTINPFGAPTFTASAPAGCKIMSSVGFPIPGDRQASVSAGLGFIVLAVVSDDDLASTKRDVPTRLIFLLTDTSSFADSGLADRLMNKDMLWEKITDDWRPEPEDRIDSGADIGIDPLTPGGTGHRIPDDPFFD